jgi:tRNA C32,U32 (ribose-2'-O)-methylase TrmJ
LGLINPEIPTETMARVRALFARTELTHNEVNFLRGMARAVIEGKGLAGETLGDK